MRAEARAGEREAPDWIRVGRVGRPHGVEGAFVVEKASEEPARFAPGASVHVAGRRATVTSAKRAGGRLVVELDAPAPRGAAIELPVSELPSLEQGSFYAFELVGLAVEEEGGRRLGRVREVEPGVANDVLALESGVLLPMVRECVRSVDLPAGRIVVARGFAEEP